MSFESVSASRFGGVAIQGSWTATACGLAVTAFFLAYPCSMAWAKASATFSPSTPADRMPPA